MNILFPFYDNYNNPSEISSYGLINDQGRVSLYNNTDRSGTPYWSLPQRSIKEFIGEDLYIFDKKTFYKVFDDDFYPNLVDVNTSLWHQNKDPIIFDYDNYDQIPINYFIRYIDEHLDYSDLNYHISDKYNHLLKASSILDGHLTIGKNKMYRRYDHYTSTGRFRDTSASSMSIKAELRSNIKTKGVLLKLDMDSFHLRILNEFINGGMPKEVRGHDWIIEQAKLNTSKEDPKVQIFRAIYSENFDSIPCRFFKKLKARYKLIDSPFGRTHHNFNYLIQEYEVLIMSKIICSINVDYIDFVLYLYDGIYIDLKEPEKLKEYISILKKTINLPFTLKVGNIEQRFYK